MPSFFIAAVPPKAVQKKLAAVYSTAKHRDLWWWNPEPRLIIQLRHLGHVDEESARMALRKLQVLAPVADVTVLHSKHVHNKKDLWVNVWGLKALADAIYELTKHVGAHQTFEDFHGHITLAWCKEPPGDIEVKLPPEQKFNVNELVLLRKPGNWGPYHVVEKVKLREFCHRCGHHCHC